MGLRLTLIVNDGRAACGGNCPTIALRRRAHDQPSGKASPSQHSLDALE